MPGELTEVTEIVTALGMLAPDLDRGLGRRPTALANLPADAWERIVEARRAGRHEAAFATAFANGRAFLFAGDGLRGRPPRLAEWRGPHRPPGDDVVPADLRVDRVYLVSCKYLSKVLLNPGPARLFGRALVGDEREAVHWFVETAPDTFQALYSAAAEATRLDGLPAAVTELTRGQQRELRDALGARAWPPDLHDGWATVCRTVSEESARRWRALLRSPRDRLRLLWRLLRISSVTYFVLGTDRAASLRLRVDSTWDWWQAYDLRAFEVEAGRAGQPQVTWRAEVRRRADGLDFAVDGHVEVRWSHGRFHGMPEAKVYLDTPHHLVPGYHPLG